MTTLQVISFALLTAALVCALYGFVGLLLVPSTDLDDFYPRLRRHKKIFHPLAFSALALLVMAVVLVWSFA